LKLHNYIHSISDNDTNNTSTSNVYELLLIRLYSLTTYHSNAITIMDDDADDNDTSKRFLLLCSYMEEIIILIKNNSSTTNDRLSIYILYLKTLCSYISAIRYYYIYYHYYY